MPLPVSAQGYFPNPALNFQAAQAGFNIGKQSSPFANIVSGLFEGAQKYANIESTFAGTEATKARTAQTQQQIEAFPAQEARAEAEQKRREKETEAKIAQDKLKEEQFNRTFGLQESKLANDTMRATAYRDSVNSQNHKRDMDASLARNKAASDAQFNGIMHSAIIKKDVRPLIYALSDLNSREAKDIMQKLGQKQNSEYVNGAKIVLEDAIVKRELRPEENIIADSILKGIDYMQNLASAGSELNDAGATVYDATGYTLNKNTDRLVINPNSAQGDKLIAIEKDGKSYEMILAPDFDKRGDLYKAVAKANQQYDRARSVENSRLAEIEASRKATATTGPSAQQQERPVKAAAPQSPQQRQIELDNLRKRLKEKYGSQG